MWILLSCACENLNSVLNLSMQSSVAGGVLMHAQNYMVRFMIDGWCARCAGTTCANNRGRAPSHGRVSPSIFEVATTSLIF